MRRAIAACFLVGSAFAGSAGATQYLAHQFGGAPELGAPLAVVSDVQVYSPLAWYSWQRQWRRHEPKPFAIAFGIGLGSVLLGLIAAGGLNGGSEKTKPTGAYGTARWADERELDEAELLGGRGVVLGQTAEARLRKRRFRRGWDQVREGRLIRDDSEQHVMVFAPTGAGKGVSVVLPTLVSCTDSTIVYDLKKENWNKTAGWRSKFSHCLRFEPTARNSVRFNPLLEVRPWPLDVRDAQNIAELLVNPDSMPSEQKDHWRLTGHAFLVAVILHVLYAEPDKSLAGVLRVLADPDRTIDELLETMLHTRHLPQGTHPTVAQGARSMMNKAEKERSSVLSTAESFLSLYRDPVIAANTSASDFALSDLTCGKQPLSLYLVVPGSDTDRVKPLMRMLMNFFGRRLTEHETAVDGPEGLLPKRHRLLYLIDEFPALGRMPFFEAQLAFLRGYGVKCLLIAQSLNQLDGTYGSHNSILYNCNIRLTFSSNDDRTAKRISELCGQTSRVKRQLIESKRNGVLGGMQASYSYQEFGRPLVTADEVLTLAPTDSILLIGGSAPYRGKKVLAYADARFRGRLGDAQSGANPPPESAAAQRAELPLRKTSPHWLSLPIPPRLASAQKQQGPLTVHGAGAPHATHEPHDDAEHLEGMSDMEWPSDLLTSEDGYGAVTAPQRKGW
jgi:type IV secretion system protein VirD4